MKIKILNWQSDIANFYVSNLDQLNQTLSVSKARENRKFIEQRVAETQTELVKVENALKEFQTQNRTVAIEAQSKAMIEATAMIQAQIMAQEVQLQVMGSYLSPNNPEVARVQSSISELRKQLQIMETGKERKRSSAGRSIASSHHECADARLGVWPVGPRLEGSGNSLCFIDLSV